MQAFTLLHPMVVHFPIAFLLTASGAGLAYLYWRPRGELLVATWWGMALGWLSLALAIISGLISQGGLPPDAPYRTLLNLHTTAGFVLLVVYGDPLYRRWLHNSAKRRRRPGEPDYPDPLDNPGQRMLFTLLFVLGALLVIASGWLGGELVYQWGVNVGGVL